MPQEEGIADLCRRFLGGAMTTEIFIGEFMPLWRMYRDTPASGDDGNQWIDRVMTAADCYGHPDPRLRLSENRLRSEIAEHLQGAQ